MTGEQERLSPAQRRMERRIDELAALRTPQQQEVARSIYERLRAGDSPDDVKDLIAEMGRVVKQERRAPGA